MRKIKKHLTLAEREALIIQEAKEYFGIHHSAKHPVAKKYHKSKLFLKWTVKLLAPDFLVGHPNLWDNMKTLAKNPRFKPFRMALAAWLIFSLTIGSSGIYAFTHAPKAEASNDFSIKTGYYYGNGTTLTISGLGFAPEVVMVKSDTAAGALVWKSSAMPAAVTAYLGVATADNTENEITLTADGFTVSQALEVNTINTRYTYIALAGSDCTATGVMCVGSYVGDGTASRAVSTGFQPNMVWAKRTTAVVGNFRTSTMSDNQAAFFSATATDTTGAYFKTLDASGGFTIGATNNVISGVYYYLAFKNTPSKVLVGQFTGNNTDNRNITGLGFEPDAMFVKLNNAAAPVFATTESWGDYSSMTTATAGAVNHIQSLQDDGFQVGNSANVNVTGAISYYFAFGGAPDPTPTDSFFMQRGSYEGTAAAKTIETSFAPDLVFIKGNTPQFAVWSTSLDTNQTHYFSNSAVAFTGGITGMDATSFSVGTNATTNTNGITYEYVAFGNATSPHTGNGAADFAIGAYTGNSISPRAIDHLGMSPNMVVAKRPIGAAALTLWRSSTMAANTSAYFSATANVTDGTGFRTFDSYGFTVGTGATVNAANATYIWFAFKEGAFFDVSSYAGNNTVDREVTGVGFAADYMWTKRNTASAAVHKSSSGTIAANTSQHFMNLVNDTNDIKVFTANGFKVGNSAEVNTTGGTYYYAAWDSTLSSNPPNTPTNTLPSNGATAQPVDTTLTGSAYTDLDNTSQTNAQWQVDDDADFSSPVWRRTADTAEISTAIATANGTFANELSGHTELEHNTTYYWRVRYSDSVWSEWSTGTNFTTNTLATPTHSSPANGATVTTRTPTLTASAFVDGQPSHTALSSQWQLSTGTAFTAPLYDSGEVSYGNAHVVPDATLSDRTVYFWRVRYKDSNGQWSDYSVPTKFLVAEASITVTALFGNTVVNQGDNVNIDVQVKEDNGTAIDNATVTVNIYNPSGAKIVDAATMTLVAGSNGIYRYPYTIPAASGSYFYEVTATLNTVVSNGAANFEVRTLASNVQDILTRVTSLQTSVASIIAEIGVGNIAAIKTKTDTIDWGDITTVLTTTGEIKSVTDTIDWADVTAIKTSTDTIYWNDVTGIKTTTDTIDWGDINAIAADVESTQNNVDILIGAMIVTQGTANDAAATTTTFISSLTNPTDDFYRNAVLTFTAGNLDGQSRRIADYDAATKVITLDPALTTAPAQGDAFTIITQNVRVEEQVAQSEVAQAQERSAQSAFRTDAVARLVSIEGKLDDLNNQLNAVDATLDTVASTVQSIRTTLLKGYRVDLSDTAEIQTGTTYRATVTTLDFESNPMDAVTLPTITIYDPTRTAVHAVVPMAQLSAGVYEYTSVVDASVVAGLWESIVTVDMGGTAPIVRNDYWQVTGAPSQVVINTMSDLTVPSIAAKATITNEGNVPYEYNYQWCVVKEQNNTCGGNDDVYHATAAKLIEPGAGFHPSLTATVPKVGDYWFKVAVDYGSGTSGASQTFTAVANTIEQLPGPKDTDDADQPTDEETTTPQGDIYDEITQTRNQLELQAQTLSQALEIISADSPAIQNLLEVNTANTENITDIQNKIADLKAVANATRRLLEQQTIEPIVETYMKFNSVEMQFIITNPDNKKQTMKFKALLPAEAKPEHMVDLDGMNINFDSTAGAYAVADEIELGPQETVTRKVEMEDVWVFKPEEIESAKKQTDGLLATVSDTQNETQGALIKNDIDSTLNTIVLRQDEGYSSPQEHIVTYRENKEQMAKVEKNIEQLKDLSVQSGASRSVIGQVSGMQAVTTWGIIAAIIVGFGLLATVVFALWRHQTMLAALAMGMHPEEVAKHFKRSKKRV